MLLQSFLCRMSDVACVLPQGTKMYEGTTRRGLDIETRVGIKYTQKKGRKERAGDTAERDGGVVGAGCIHSLVHS